MPLRKPPDTPNPTGKRRSRLNCISLALPQSAHPLRSLALLKDPKLRPLAEAIAEDAPKVAG